MSDSTSANLNPNAQNIVTAAVLAAGTEGIGLTIDPTSAVISNPQDVLAQLAGALPSVAVVPEGAANRVTVKIQGSTYEVDHVEGMTLANLAKLVETTYDKTNLLGGYDWTLAGSTAGLNPDTSVPVGAVLNVAPKAARLGA
jgi:hypothetical protein